MIKFKIGDVVQVKSGGPLMTISHVEAAGPAKASWDFDRDSNEYYCQWFENGILKWGNGGFKEEALKLANKS